MKEKPILFSAPMVRAILEGRKTQTRRVVRKQFAPDADPAEVSATSPEGWQISGHAGLWWDDAGACIDDAIRCPYGQPGDRLWVRETWRYTASTLEESRAITEDITSGIAVDWRATYIDRCMKELGFSREEAEMADDFKTWRPSIHMPRWASRILLEVTGVRVERLNDISDVDSLSEGITSVRSNEFDVEHFKDWKERFDTAVASGEKPPVGPSPKESFKALWESINGSGSWEANQFVWVISFKRIDNA